MTLSSELLPAPLGPMMARISPGSTARSTSRNAATPPKVNAMSLSASTGRATRSAAGAASRS
ncbi:hypothetical protein ACVILL_001372 [Bradyrhizobium sp. USDA 3364]